MNTFALKLIAIIVMLIDHIGAMFIPRYTDTYLVFRSVGRLAFPIFVFLIVEGFHHTRNVKKYLIRLGIFAMVSEIPFDLAFYGKIIEFTHQNVFFTLFLGLLLISLLGMIQVKLETQFILANLCCTVLVLAFCIIAVFLRTDYDYSGILIMTAFFLFRGNRIATLISLFIITVLMYSDSIHYPIAWIFIACTTLSMLLISLYNGQKGKNVKYLFYVFYPAHLLILYIIKSFL